MDLGRDLWALYLEKHCPLAVGERPVIDELRPMQVCELIWKFNSIFAAKASVLEGVSLQTAFDKEADLALTNVANTGSVECLEGIELGTWRILYDRHLWSICALTLEESNPEAFTVPIPRNVDQHIRAMAAWLAILAGPGRAPSVQWRSLSISEQKQGFPASLSTRQQ